MIVNATRWAAPVNGPTITWDNVKPLEKLGS